MPSSDTERFVFASDNVSGLIPESWAELARANGGAVPSYGSDEWTRDASEAIRELFGEEAEVFFVFNGTAANSMAISHLCQSYHSVIVHETAHVETDECGGPEFFSNGTKLLLASGQNGKLEPASAEALITKRSDIHFPKPRLLSITTPTECGTVYGLSELLALREVKERHALRVHMDGARFGNAVVSLGCEPREIVEAAGVDVLCFGAIKAGFSLGEAVVFLRRDLANEFDYRCKQAGQLASKMRFLCAPWAGALRSGIWLNSARSANAQAQALARTFLDLGFAPEFPVEANAVFVRLPAEVRTGLRDRGWRFYDFIGGASRFMCHWATTTADVNSLGTDLKELADESRQKH